MHEISRQMHEISRQMHEISRQMHEISRQMREISRQMHEISRQMHEISRQMLSDFHSTTLSLAEIIASTTDKLNMSIEDWWNDTDRMNRSIVKKLVKRVDKFVSLLNYILRHEPLPSIQFISNWVTVINSLLS
jgi:methyl-accepting chemotaxis protein